MFDFDITPLSAQVLGIALLFFGLRVTDVAQVPVIEQDMVAGILSREQVLHYVRLRNGLGV